MDANMLAAHMTGDPMLLLFSLFFQSAQSYSAFAAGLAFLPITVAIMGTNILSGRFIASFGPRKVIVARLLLAASGYEALLTLTAHSQNRHCI
ncbi:MAG TPA: hypothetical protein VK638_38925 [Edaphobacter sp.]|nr:hypothetical protein [Edaphobacter sp.]